MDLEERNSGEKKCRWWTKRTKIEKCSVVIIALSTLLILFLASNLFLKFPSDKQNGNICLSEKCIRYASDILDAMDKTINPCEDFYKFACGGFIKKAIIPEERTLISTFSVVNDKVMDQLGRTFQEPIHENRDPRYLKLIKMYHKACMNTTKNDREGLPYMKKVFKDLGGWPVIDTNWNEKEFDWKMVLYKLRRIGWRRNLFFSMYVGVDSKNSTKRILTLAQPCMNTETLKKGKNDTVVKAMFEYYISLALLFGAEKRDAVAEIEEVVDFQISLAKIIVPYKERENITKEYNPISIRDLQRNFSTIPWLQYINVYLYPHDTLSAEDIVNVKVPKFFSNLEDLLIKTRRRVLANYLFLRLVTGSIDFLPDIFRDKELEYHKAAYGKGEKTPRWKLCLWQTARMNIAVSAVYVKNYFPRSTKHKVTELVIDIKGSFLDTLRKVGWMDRKTKRHAMMKAEKMNSFIAYPEELLDDDKVNEIYEELEINSEDYYLEVSFNISHLDHKNHIKKLREPVYKGDWRGQAYSFYVNAFYDQNENAIELPAAILQENFFDPDRPQYMNYGSLGEIIGHEITHGFDNHGRQYDKNGNLVDWWEPETNTTFTRKSMCLVQQYGNYTVPEVELKVDGLKTLGENIADNGGIKIAYRGYLKWVERNPDSRETALPGLHKYGPKQMFWISAANNWCSKYTKEMLKNMIQSGMHAPNYFRVTVPFMNSDYFARDFNCLLGSPMNPKFKCRVW